MKKKKEDNMMKDLMSDLSGGLLEVFSIMTIAWLLMELLRGTKSPKKSGRLQRGLVRFAEEV